MINKKIILKTNVEKNLNKDKIKNNVKNLIDEVKYIKNTETIINQNTSNDNKNIDKDFEINPIEKSNESHIPIQAQINIDISKNTNNNPKKKNLNKNNININNTSKVFFTLNIQDSERYNDKNNDNTENTLPTYQYKAKILPGEETSITNKNSSELTNNKKPSNIPLSENIIQEEKKDFIEKMKAVRDSTIFSSDNNLNIQNNDMINSKIPSNIINQNIYGNFNQNNFTNPNTMKFLHPFPINILNLSASEYLMNVASPYINLGLCPSNISPMIYSPYQNDLFMLHNRPQILSNNACNENVPFEKSTTNNFNSNENVNPYNISKPINSEEYFINYRMLSPSSHKKNIVFSSNENDLFGKDDNLENKNIVTINNPKNNLLGFEKKDYNDKDKMSNDKNSKNIEEDLIMKEDDASKNIGKEDNLCIQNLNVLKSNMDSLFMNNENGLYSQNQIKKFFNNTKLQLLDIQSPNNYINSINPLGFPFYPASIMNSPFHFSEINCQLNNNNINNNENKIFPKIDSSNILPNDYNKFNNNHLTANVNLDKTEGIEKLRDKDKSNDEMKL